MANPDGGDFDSSFGVCVCVNVEQWDRLYPAQLDSISESCTSAKMRPGLPKAYVVSTFTGEYKEHKAYCIRDSSEKESILCLVFNPTTGVSIPYDMSKGSTLVAVSPLRVCVEPSDAVLIDRVDKRL